jgi:hypothetical protein
MAIDLLAMGALQQPQQQQQQQQQSPMQQQQQQPAYSPQLPYPAQSPSPLPGQFPMQQQTPTYNPNDLHAYVQQQQQQAIAQLAAQQALQQQAAQQQAQQTQSQQQQQQQQQQSGTNPVDAIRTEAQNAVQIATQSAQQALDRVKQLEAQNNLMRIGLKKPHLAEYLPLLPPTSDPAQLEQMVNQLEQVRLADLQRVVAAQQQQAQTMQPVQQQDQGQPQGYSYTSAPTVPGVPASSSIPPQLAPQNPIAQLTMPPVVPQPASVPTAYQPYPQAPQIGAQPQLQGMQPQQQLPYNTQPMQQQQQPMQQQQNAGQPNIMNWYAGRPDMHPNVQQLASLPQLGNQALGQMTQSPQGQALPTVSPAQMNPQGAYAGNAAQQIQAIYDRARASGDPNQLAFAHQQAIQLAEAATKADLYRR